MPYVWQRHLPETLRAAGLTVVEVEGWQNRGRPASTGHFNPRGLQVTHHTAATSSAANPAPGLQTLIQGRSDLPGPLCQTAIAYDGTVYVVAAGRANVNGRKRPVPNWPESDGNEQMGCEVITNGTQPLPAAQVHAIAVHNKVMLDHFGREADGYLYRHEDISLTGKWDIGNRTTEQLRADVRAIAPPPPPPPVPEEDDMPQPRIITAKDLDDKSGVGDFLMLATADGRFVGLQDQDDIATAQRYVAFATTPGDGALYQVEVAAIRDLLSRAV
jgi:hypothetical protein